MIDKYNKMKRGKNKKGMAIETLIYWLIAITILALIIGFIVLLKTGTLQNLLDYLRRLL
jgi:TM2 domain-containing membrane protein YozV